jgi:ribonuclease P protein component
MRDGEKAGIKFRLPLQEKAITGSLEGKYTFPKALRLRKSYEFANLSKVSERINAHFITVYFAPTVRPLGRLGITISKKIHKSAVVRNRFKRAVREEYRHISSSLNFPLKADLNVCARALVGEKLSIKNVATRRHATLAIRKEIKKVICQIAKSHSLKKF